MSKAVIFTQKTPPLPTVDISVILTPVSVILTP